MKASGIISIALVALSALAVIAPPTVAHNPYKYTSVTFVKAGYCRGGYASFVTVNRQLVLQVLANDFTNSVLGGFEVYNTIPGVNAPGNPNPPVTPGTFPQGNLTFNINPVPPAAYFYVDFTAGSNFAFVPATISGNTVSMNASNGTAGATTYIIYGYIQGPSPSNTTFILSNFRLNNQPLLFDTTSADTNAFCS